MFQKSFHKPSTLKYSCFTHYITDACKIEDIQIHLELNVIFLTCKDRGLFIIMSYCSGG